MKMELRRRALDKIYKRRDRIDMPDFQREEVWSDEQKRRLIDTILRCWHLPKFYFRNVDESSFECVDGQQRLVAIWEFFDNNLRLEAAAARKYGGGTYAKLREEYSDAFDDFEIDIEEIEDASDDELEELFVRLQLGTPLTTAEKLNALGGEARDFARWMSDQLFFRERIAVRDTRYAHFDISVKWLFVQARGVQPQMRFSQLEEFLKVNRSFDQGSNTAKQIKSGLKYLERAFPVRSDLLRNRASVLSVCMLASKVVEAKILRETAEQFGAFLQKFFTALTVEVEKGSRSTESELLDYQEAISYGSTGGQSLRQRLTILARRLATFSGDFTPLLRGGEGVGSVESNLATVAEEVSTLIYSANEKASSSTGHDVFKMTNRSSRAMKALGSSCSTEKEFGDLVDRLYFLVYEGSGDCKRLPSPPPEYAMDVKFLRNYLRHDLDHGDAKDAAKKRRRGARILKKYAGKGSLGECGPEDFMAAQPRLLEGLKRMLTAL